MNSHTGQNHCLTMQCQTFLHDLTTCNTVGLMMDSLKKGMLSFSIPIILVKIIDCINNGLNIWDVTHWFVDCCFEASHLDFGRRHLVFLEPEVTKKIGNEGDTDGECRDARRS